MFAAKKICFFTIHSIFSILGIIFICCLPKLLVGEVEKEIATVSSKAYPLLQFNWDRYVGTVKKVINLLTSPSQITYEIHGIKRALFPYLLESYFYTITIMVSAFLIALFLSIILTNFTFYFSKQVQSFILKTLNILESLPDLFFVLLIQLIVIWIYKKTNWLMTPPFSTIQGKIYLLPILSLAILPTIYLYKIILLDYKTELTKGYIEFAVAKGLPHLYILYKHVLSNVLLSIFYNAKAIFLFMISNMIVLEFLFNSFGLLKFLINHPTPEIMSVGIIILMLPFNFAFEIFKWIFPERRDVYV